MKFKKFTSIFAAAVFAVSVTACGQTTTDVSNSAADPSVVDTALGDEKSAAMVEFDPFADLKVSFNGAEPFGTVSIIQENSELRESGYQANKDTLLKNGDVITVTISSPTSDDYEEYCRSILGMLPTATTKEYTVEGLDKYITSISDIPDNEMSEKSKNCFTYNTTDTTAEYLGSYLFHIKDSQVYLDNKAEHKKMNYINTLYDVYKVTNSEIIYYSYTSFDDVILRSDGTYDVEGLYGTPADYRIDDFDDDSKYVGFKSIDSMLNALINEYGDNYEYESTVSDK